MKKLIFPVILCLVIATACADKKSDWPVNPNGDSELALLMRQMFDEGMLAKEAIASGEEIDLVMKHEGIFTVQATEPDKQASELYKAFGTHYLELVEELNDPNNQNPEESYDKLVASCINCHSALCPGPIKKIQHLEMK